MTPGTAARRVPLARPATAWLLGGLLLALAIADVPLSRLAHQSLNASGGSLPVWFSVAYGAVGLVVAWRKPGNPLGWIFLLVGLFSALAEDASFYMVADYRLRHGSLPLGWAAVLTQPGWAPTVALLGVAVLLFPDGRPPSRRWRWVLWAYCHVPAGSTVDMTARIEAQIERFAPGFTGLVLARQTRTAAQEEALNPNYVGGDIACGAQTVRQVLARPAARWNPYRTPLRGVYLCSSATPPGPAVHGRCGELAALTALRDVFGVHQRPDLGTLRPRPASGARRPP